MIFWVTRLVGDEHALFTSQALSTSLKITGVDVFSAGALMAEGESDDEITLRDDNRGLYKKIVVRDGQLVGAVLYGDVADGHWYLSLMRSKTDISEIRDKLVFGRAFAESLPAGRSRNAVICKSRARFSIRSRRCGRP